MLIFMHSVQEYFFIGYIRETGFGKQIPVRPVHPHRITNLQRTSAMSILKTLFGTHDEPITSFEQFWNWFRQNERSFYRVVKQNGDIEREFFNKLSPKLNLLNEGIFYLTGMYDDKTVELVITAEGAVKNISFVEELVERAPAIEGWKFTALKPELNIRDVNIEMDSCTFSAANMSFYSNDYAEYPDEIDITIVHDELNEENRATIVNGTYIFLDNLLGEYKFVTTIDNISVIGRHEASKELVPIAKLKDFLVWREKEFIEKYEGLRHNTESDNYAVLEAQLENGEPLIAVVNTGLLEWDCKASHPWILNVEVKYDGKESNGLPDEATCLLLGEMENSICAGLKDYEGYLNIGRQTVAGVRTIYFACRDFRKPSKTMRLVMEKYSEQIDIDFNIYKDKYWQSFNRFLRTRLA